MEDLAASEGHQGFALFHEMGMGKTCSACHFARIRYYRHGRVLRTLVLGPPIVVENWRREFLMHTSVGDLVVTLTGAGTKRVKRFDQALVKQREQIFVTNYEALLMPELYKRLQKWNPELIIADESHLCKNHSSKRSKLLQKLADKAAYKLLLTGTPITRSPMDIFSQFRILDGGETFGRNFNAFRNTYFYDENAGWSARETHFPKWVPDQKRLPELTRLMRLKSSIRRKEDCLSLPPLVRKQVFVELSGEQARLYKEMKKDFITFVRDKACVATLAITKALRLQQIVSGFVTVEGEEKREDIAIKENPRAVALRDLLSEITAHSKCLVWATFRDNYRTIRTVAEGLGLDFVEVHGGIPAKTKQEAVDRFNSDENCKVFIGNPGSGGIGINLVSASYSIFYSRNFSLEQDLQAEARNYRPGSERHAKITRIDLIAPGTIDEHIFKSLQAKQDISDKVLFSIADELEAE